MSFSRSCWHASQWTRLIPTKCLILPSVRYGSSLKGKKKYFYGHFRTRKQNRQLELKKSKLATLQDPEATLEEQQVEESLSHQRIRRSFRYLIEMIQDPSCTDSIFRSLAQYEKIRSCPGLLKMYDFHEGFSLQWMLATEHPQRLYTETAIAALNQVEQLDMSMIEQPDERYQVNPSIFMRLLSVSRGLESIQTIPELMVHPDSPVWSMVTKSSQQVWWNDILHFTNMLTLRRFPNPTLPNSPDVVLQTRIRFYMEFLPRLHVMAVEDVVKIILDLDGLRKQHQNLKSFIDREQYAGLKTEIAELYEPLSLAIERSYLRHSTVLSSIRPPTLWTRHAPYYKELTELLELMESKYKQGDDFPPQDAQLVHSIMLFFNWLNVKLQTNQLTRMTQYFMRRLLVERFMTPFAKLRGMAKPSSDWMPPRHYQDSFHKVFDKSQRLYSIVCDSLEAHSHTHAYHTMMATYYTERTDNEKLTQLYQAFDCDVDLKTNRADYITTKTVYLEAFARLNNVPMVIQVLYGPISHMKQDPWKCLADLPELKYIKTFAILVKLFADKGEWERVDWIYKIVHQDPRLWNGSIDSCVILSNYVAASIELQGSVDSSMEMLEKVKEAYIGIQTDRAKENMSLIYYTVIVKCCTKKWMNEAEQVLKQMVQLQFDYHLSALVMMKFYHVYGNQEAADAVLAEYIKPLSLKKPTGALEKGEYRVYNELIEMAVFKNQAQKAQELFQELCQRALSGMNSVKAIKWLYGPTLVHMIHLYLKRGDIENVYTILEGLLSMQVHRISPCRWRYLTERSFIGSFDISQYAFFSQDKLNRIVKELPPLYQGYYALIQYHCQLNQPHKAIQVIQEFIQAKQLDTLRHQELESVQSSVTPIQCHPLLFHSLIEFHAKRKEWQHIYRLYDTMSQVGVLPMWISLYKVYWQVAMAKRRSLERQHLTPLSPSDVLCSPLAFVQSLIQHRYDTLSTLDSPPLLSRFPGEKAYLYNSLLGFYLSLNAKQSSVSMDIDQVVVHMDKEQVGLYPEIEKQLKERAQFDDQVALESSAPLPKNQPIEQQRTVQEYVYPQ